MDKTDLIVCGGGITGLITAIAARRKGSTALLLEANDRVGGQIYSGYVRENNNVALDLGAEYIDIGLHYTVIDEINKRRLMMSKVDYSSNFYTFEDKSIFNELTVHEIINHTSYINALRVMNDLSQRLVFANGFDQRDFTSLDVPFSDFMITTLQLMVDTTNSAACTTIAYKVRELILIQAFLLTGCDPSLQSTLGLFYIFRGFGSVENAFAAVGGVDNRKPSRSRAPSGMYRVDGGISRLVSSMVAEFESLGGVIRLNSPVIGITALQPSTSSTAKSGAPNYDYPESSHVRRDVLIKLASGQTLTSRAVVVAVPLCCLPSIVFTPPLANCLKLAGERCNTGQQYVKVYGKASGVSSRVDHAVSYSRPAKDVQTVAFSLAEGGSSAATTTRTALFSRREERDSDDDEEQRTETVVVRLTGWRRDLLCGADIGAALRRTHPVAELISSTCSTIHGSNKSAMTHFHDFPSDRWSRGSWFALRAGTGALHVEASRAARSPWGLIESDTQTGSASERAKDGSEVGPLIIACSDLHPVWTGWVEGGLLAGLEAAQRIAPYLDPPKTDRNFFKRIYPQKK